MRARTGIAIVADDGTVLVDAGGDRPMTPASTLKLIVGSTAFFTLGPGYRFVTSLESYAPPARNGTLDALWLVGRGDPALTSDQLAGGAVALRRRGVRTVRELFVDAARFAGPEQNPQWLPDDDRYAYGAGTSAISVDQDVAVFDVAPYPGARPRAVVAPIHGIPAYVAREMRRMLADAGIAVGSVGIAPGPLAGTLLWEQPSATMARLVKQMFLESNNHFAEQLLRTLGAEDGVGTEATGARAERRFLDRIDVPSEGLRIVDGSGLAPSDRVTPLTLATLLQRVAALPRGPGFVATLPRAGIEGTVRYHQLTSAAGRVRAKSGHIDGVDALAGYVETRHHGRVTFAFVFNGAGPSDALVEGTYDLTLDRLSEF